MGVEDSPMHVQVCTSVSDERVTLIVSLWMVVVCCNARVLEMCPCTSVIM